LAQGIYAFRALGEKRAGREAVALIRLHAIVEGPTEEAFVNEVIAPELWAHNIFVDVHSITTRRTPMRVFRGGWGSYEKLAGDLTLWMRQDSGPECWFTTMIDLYGLPADFPGYEACRAIAEPRKRVECLEVRFARDIEQRLPELGAARRFIPNIQLHEFEALLFAEPAPFADVFPDQQAVVGQLRAIRDQAGGPENIDDGATTAPSKRIERLVRGYAKTVSGLLISQRIGLPVLRRECPHFDGWITKILKLAA
jgi:Domain of unknown function (DUF4276)